MIRVCARRPAMLCRWVGIAVLSWLLLLTLGCSATRTVQRSPQRPFRFGKDTFAYANELLWHYDFDPVTGKASHSREELKPAYTHHCFVVARSTRQFFDNARFDPARPVGMDQNYRAAIEKIVHTDARHALADPVVIPGYSNLFEFSRAKERLLKETCGGAHQSYFQRGHWRMIFPLSAAHQQKMARQLAKITEKADLPSRPICFPQGISTQFILDVLKAWRAGQVVCPLDRGQRAPEVACLPPGVIHLKLTSASTGSGKLIVFTAAQLAADAENIVQTMGLRPEWPNIGLISFAHSYGFSNLITPLLLYGIPLIVSDSALPEAIRLANSVAAEGYALPAVPALWRVWHDAGVLDGAARLAISAGAPLPIQLEQEIFDASGLKIHNFYGASECGGIAYDRSSTCRTDASCVGSPLQNVALSIGDEGRLKVRSAAVGESYWPKPGAELRGGVFQTSDIAQIQEGLIYLRGRSTDEINVAGRKVLPDTIERGLLNHPQVRECTVFGLLSSTPERVEEIVACVITEGALSEGALHAFAAESLPLWQVPRHWWFVKEIQRNERGKVNRAELRQAYLKMREPA